MLERAGTQEVPSVGNGQGLAMVGSSLPGEGWGWEDRAWEAGSAGGGEGVRGRVSHPVER